jgi:uncharacterized protein YodC (DUF2158 family)
MGIGVEFQPGDQVQLKSGGPVMTVERTGKDQRTQEDVVFCVWFHFEGKKQILTRDSFIPATIQKYDFGAGFAVVTTRL